MINADLLKKLIFDEDDFGHEMRVGDAIRENRFNLSQKVAYVHGSTHGGTYIDAMTEKHRQFDFRCEIRYGHGYPQPTEKSLLLSVECKNLHESAPLIICAREREEGESFHMYVESRLGYTPNYARVPSSRFYSTGDFVGKSLLRAKRDGRDRLKADTSSDIYDRWAQAIASGKEIADGAGGVAQKRNVGRVLSFIMPVVVVPNEKLWIARYDSGGNIPNPLELTDECQYFLAAPLIGNVQSGLIASHVHFVTLKGFNQLLGRILCNPGTWDRLFI